MGMMAGGGFFDDSAAVGEGGIIGHAAINEDRAAGHVGGRVRHQQHDHAGDFMIPIAEGIIAREKIAEIADLVGGVQPGRSSDEEITYYKSIGVPIQDLVTAQHIERRAEQKGIGSEIDIGGEED